MPVSHRSTPWVTANIGRGVPTAVAKRNIVKVRRAFSPETPVVGWQEIDEADQPDEHALLEHVFGNRFEQAGFEGKEPISVPRHVFALGPVTRTKIMDGVGRAEPGSASPTRYVVTQILRPIGCTGPIAAVNTHFANFEPSDPRWVECLTGLRSEVARLHEQGIPVVWTGDTNANRPANMPLVHSTERRVIAAGNDYLGIVPGHCGPRIAVHGTGTINLTIDGHNAHWARLSFRDRKVAR